MKERQPLGLVRLILGLLTAGALLNGASSKEVEALLKKGKTGSAETLAAVSQKLLCLDPKSGDAYVMQACVEYNQGHYESTIADCSKALELHPKDPFFARKALNYRYHAYIQQKEWTKALNDCLQCLKVEATAGVAHDAAVLSKKAGHTADAVKYQGLAQKYDQDMRQKITALITTMQAARDPKRVDATLSRLNVELKEKPDDVNMLRLKSACLMTKGQLVQCQQCLSRAAALEPDDWSIYISRAKVWEKLGKSKEAAQDRAKARELGYDPTRFRRAGWRPASKPETQNFQAVPD